MFNSHISRRAWLTSIFVGGMATISRADALASVRERGRKAGLGDFQLTPSKEFQAIGDAPNRFRVEALDRCDKLANVFRNHFTSKGFEVKKPDGLLTLVTLKSPESYAAYTGRPLETAVGGHYDLDTNELVMFDLRQDEAKGLASPVEANNLVLIHEATHLLCFNTGLLSRSNDAPVAISEGLACYGEPWRPKLKNTTFGGPNPGRAQVFAASKAAGLDWIPLDRLVADDSVFADMMTQQLAYAESWLLIWNMLGNASKRPKLKAALSKVAQEQTPEGRVAAIVDGLGLDARADEDLRRVAKWSR